ncbi:hypothetical protein CUMW_257570 [Citrus unshiu]|uniref:F-box/LRR-repeat protein 15/At3g58940/PEG3-like LRR domain-containing protein n=1 Tax=Citrus unshiu TaxID=55188 RepID=A0A2H5QSG7_CITUN|nr:hypothetical protein CUMW_257570 [Citrus unshiu]
MIGSVLCRIQSFAIFCHFYQQIMPSLLAFYLQDGGMYGLHFRLCCSMRQYASGRVISLMLPWKGLRCLLKELGSLAVMRDVRELELNIENQQRVQLPESIYSCRSLQVLKLDSDFDIAVPGSGICFPNVKFLRVSLQYPENQLTEKLFSSCPSIEELWLKVYLKYDGPATNFIISSSTLKRLYWTVLVDDYNFAFNNCEHKCFIMAPLIEILHVVDDLMVSYEVHDLQFLQTVNVGIFFPDWSVLNPWEAVQLVNAVLNCKNLTLSSGVILVR